MPRSIDSTRERFRSALRYKYHTTREAWNDSDELLCPHMRYNRTWFKDENGKTIEGGWIATETNPCKKCSGGLLGKCHTKGKEPDNPDRTVVFDIGTAEHRSADTEDGH